MGKRHFTTQAVAYCLKWYWSRDRLFITTTTTAATTSWKEPNGTSLPTIPPKASQTIDTPKAATWIAHILICQQVDSLYSMPLEMFSKQWGLQQGQPHLRVTTISISRRAVTGEIRALHSNSLPYFAHQRPLFGSWCARTCAFSLLRFRPRHLYTG